MALRFYLILSSSCFKIQAGIVFFFHLNFEKVQTHKNNLSIWNHKIIDFKKPFVCNLFTQVPPCGFHVRSAVEKNGIFNINGHTVTMANCRHNDVFNFSGRLCICLFTHLGFLVTVEFDELMFHFARITTNDVNWCYHCQVLEKL